MVIHICMSADLPPKKGLHKANTPDKEVKITVYETKRANTRVKWTVRDNEREFRQALAQKVSGTSVGLWLKKAFLLSVQKPDNP